MVTNNRGRFQSQVNQIQKILQNADVPKQWYSINEPFECRVSIVPDYDGIHVFVPERGRRTGEKTYPDWYDAIKDIAEFFELSYTNAVMKIADTIARPATKSGMVMVPIMHGNVAARRFTTTHGSIAAHRTNIVQGVVATTETQFDIGDTVRVWVNAIEGNSKQLKAFEGTVISKLNRGNRETFTVRRISDGIGIERTFPINSPRVDHVDIIRKGKVRRAKIYHVKNRKGKAARIRRAALD